MKFWFLLISVALFSCSSTSYLEKHVNSRNKPILSSNYSIDVVTEGSNSLREHKVYVRDGSAQFMVSDNLAIRGLGFAYLLGEKLNTENVELENGKIYSRFEMGLLSIGYSERDGLIYSADMGFKFKRVMNKQWYNTLESKLILQSGGRFDRLILQFTPVLGQQLTNDFALELQVRTFINLSEKENSSPNYSDLDRSYTDLYTSLAINLKFIQHISTRLNIFPQIGFVKYKNYSEKFTYYGLGFDFRF